MLSLDYPFVEWGDDGGTLEAWRFVGFDDTNTDRGRLYIESTVAGGALTVAGYKGPDKAASDKVFEGTGGTAGARLTLAAANGSRLSGSVKVVAVSALSTIRLQVMLASILDLRDIDPDIDRLLGSARITFADVVRQTSRAFYTRMAGRIPPPVSIGRGLAFGGGSPAQEAGRSGRVDTAAYYLWTLNGDGQWEMTGLANAPDYRMWAAQDSLARIWQSRASGGADDAMLGRSVFHAQQAEAEWRLITPWVDVDADGQPDRPTLTRSLRVRRA